MMGAIEGWYRTQGKTLGIADGRTGSITPLLEDTVQRFGSDLALNVHFHVLCLDGVCDRAGIFTAIAAPSIEQMESLCTTIAARVQRLLVRRAIKHDEPEERGLALSLSRSARDVPRRRHASLVPPRRGRFDWLRLVLAQGAQHADRAGTHGTDSDNGRTCGARV
jgi:hypothetical protein